MSQFNYTDTWYPEGLNDEQSHVTKYGLRWDWEHGNGRQGFNVERLSSQPGRGAVLAVDAGEYRLQIYLSEGGRSLRVWRDGVELVEQDSE